MQRFAYLRAPLVFIVITLFGAIHANLAAQEVSNQALPNDPSSGLPIATVVPPPEDASLQPTIDSDKQSRVGDLYTLEGHVTIHYRNYVVHADHIDYNSVTGDAKAVGHLLLTGGDDDATISASHAEFNLQSETGKFYDVTGSVGVRTTGTRTYYTSGNPFLFAGQMVVKDGPKEYHIYRGWITSCQLPNPDWQLFSGHIEVNEDEGKAHASNSIFHLANVPFLYLPYVTHPIDVDSRESGIMIPVLTQSSTKGIVIGEEFYFVLGRSADMTIGAQYFSRRGWEQSASFRFIGRGSEGYDFAHFRYNGVVDRGFIQSNGGYTNQGGEDVSFLGRHDFSPRTRGIADIEYLSSYVYREAFSGSFNQAVSSDLLSTGYLVHQVNGFSTDVRVDRYQGLKRVPIPATATNPGTSGQQVHILHVPSLDLQAVDHRLGNTPFFWNAEGSATGLKRVQPNFTTGGVVERYDMHPQLGLTLSGGGWHTASTVAIRDTVYSRSLANNESVFALVPVQSPKSLNRADVEFQVDIRPPVAERTFHTPGLSKILGTDIRHTIEPTFTYRKVSGIGDQFLNVLRFDDIDVVSNTNEIEYGVTQHFFARGGAKKPCPNGIAGATSETDESQDSAAAQQGGVNPGGADDDTGDLLRTGSRPVPCPQPQHEWISWRLAQKLFLDQDFGHTVQRGRRNIFNSTLDLSGIAFLTEPRETSPLISRLRIRTTNHLDVAWDFDLDAGAKKFTANNMFLDGHAGNWRTELSYARLNAPGRATISTPTGSTTSAVSNFSQLRMLVGYGQTTKPGFSAAANAGYDLNLGGLQYGVLQAGYNWDCCGLNIEYRKFELGSVRNEGSYRFSFSLANIGAAGNLRKAERLF